MCKAVTQNALSGIVCFPELGVTVPLLTTKADSAALSLAHLTAARVEPPHVTALPRLGHECLKAAIQAR